ncbi:MAG: type II toxin-antitoxin system HicA family toxin [Verrucomicrobia bacterium]|nr:type II toxin-antitoxin system HicA family toxin [Verrucomicrobiota bacterium]
MTDRLPTLTDKQLLKILLRAGCVIKRQTGSHAFLYHPLKERQATLSLHSRDLRRGMLMQIVAQLGFTEDEFRALL